MAIPKSSDGSIQLREGRGDIFSTLAKRFGKNPHAPSDERIGGSVMLLTWSHERDGVRYATMATAGLERIPFEGVAPFELVCEVLEEQVGAAAVALRIVVQRAIEELEAPWEPGRVWFNDQPILTGTRIRGLVVGPDPDGAEIIDEDGNPAGDLQRVWLLTEPEAESVSAAGLEPLVTQTWSRFRHLLADVERTQDAMALRPARESLPYPDMPPAGPGTGPRRDTAELAGTPIVVVKWLATHAVRWIECNERGRFVAFTQLEKPAELQDQANFEVWTLDRVVARNPWLEEFARTARTGDYASYDDANERWIVGRL